MSSVSPVEYRHLRTIQEFEEAVRVQHEVWGFDDVELVPSRLLLVADKVGGQVIGAFEGDRLIGYCFSIPGLKKGQPPYLHSHMLAVLPEYRNRGVGRRLKLAQRDDALARDVKLVEWTFDPLELKNAFFNIERLGAVIRRYVINNYGITSSKLSHGLPTDRCVAEWWLDTPRTEAILGGRSREREPVEATVSIPVEIDSIRLERITEAKQILADTAKQFQYYFDRGFVVTGFESSAENGTYLLSAPK